MIPLIKDFLKENGSAVIHFNNGEKVEIISLDVWGLPDHTYHAVATGGDTLFFDTPDVITFVSSK
ncbi:MAG: hypothetical protein ABF709_05150 [Leuconostoc pseudomesenteroides]|uniref:hypothetical protein n=1 Tax=Leuconostoc pseudomesenteroides TaxID=33968 RepID=UPI001E42C023|nr:hypothetical protein [Leuconostoc pseudomesenteroides]MCC7668895.1 hypothetical protein [Leuconostoc pseudomesenteroides]